jgi:YegS/Rv2252/BmrU family lipid kinase
VRVRAILNPRAGVSRDEARRAAESGHPRWDDFDLAVTEGPGHATELARAAVGAGAELVISVGGDGTANEVARGLLGSATALGIVPMGSGTGLARALRLPLRPRAALDAIDAGVRRAIDVGVLNGQPFLNVAGAGFDAAVSRAFHESGRAGGRRGLLGYVRLSLREMRRYRPQPVVIEADGERVELTPFVLTVANGPQYGSGAVINPGGKLDDGELELVALPDAPLPSLIAASPRMFAGGVERLPGYLRLRAARFVVTCERPLLAHRDGDPDLSSERIEVALQPRALSVVVPAATAADARGPFVAATPAVS